MSHEYLLWIALAAYAVHLLEELSFNWKEWAHSTLGLTSLEWNHFYVANSAVMFIAIAAVMVGWKLPAFGLIIVVLMLINGIFFHILPTIIQRKISPGVITAVILFLPVASWIYYGAYLDGVLSVTNFCISIILGGALMTSPIAFIKLNAKINNP